MNLQEAYTLYENDTDSATFSHTEKKLMIL